MENVSCNGILRILTIRHNFCTYSFFCKLRKLIVSPNPVKASSVMLLMLLDRRSRWRNRWRRLRASLGIEWMLLSPSLRYCRFSVQQGSHSPDCWSWDSMFPCSQSYFSFKPCEQQGKTIDIIILYSFPKKRSSKDKVRLKMKMVM
jgi:hypothetical protein